MYLIQMTVGDARINPFARITGWTKGLACGRVGPGAVTGGGSCGGFFRPTTVLCR